MLSAGRCGTVLQAHVSRKGLLRMKRGCVLYGIGARRGLGWSEWCGGRSGGRMGLKRSLVCGRKGMKRDVVVAELRGKGKRLLARDIRVKRIMGEGAFGQVFEVGEGCGNCVLMDVLHGLHWYVNRCDVCVLWDL